MCIGIDPPIRCTALPSRKNICEAHIERAGSEHILGDLTLVIVITRESIIGDKCIQRCTVICTLDMPEEGVESGIFSNLRRSVVVLW